MKPYSAKYARLYLGHLASRPMQTELTHEEERLREECENDLYTCARYLWPALPVQPFREGRCIQYITEHLEALYDLQFRTLVINQPYRTGKTLIGNVMFSVWCFIQLPSIKFVTNSYSLQASSAPTRLARQVISSDLFQRFWGNRVRIPRGSDLQTEFHTTAGGFRMARGVKGGNTSFGGDINIYDDVNNVAHINSPAWQFFTNQWFDVTMSSRYQDVNTHRKLVIQQRAGTRDLTQHLLEREDPEMVFLRLPMEYISTRPCITVPLKSTQGARWQDPREVEGQLLWPEYYTQSAVQRLKIELNHNAQAIACQLQQQPIMDQNTFIAEKWFQKWTKPHYPKFLYVLQSWDTAMVEGESACYSACVTIGVWEEEIEDLRGKIKVRKLMLVSLYAAQLNNPDLRIMASRLARNWNDIHLDAPRPKDKRFRPHHVLIERKASGYGLIDDLIRENYPIVPFNPNPYGNKEERLRKVVDLIANGQFYVPTAAPHYKELTSFSRDFVEACTIFPLQRRGGISNDVVDATSQALILLKSTGWITFDDSDIDIVKYEKTKGHY